MFDGVFTHVAGIGRLFFNTPFAQPVRTRTWHEDHDFPEVAFPFSTATFTDPITGGTAALLRGDGSDPMLIETNTATEYWQKGASLLHTDPDGTRDATLPDTVRGYFLTGTNHTGRAGVPRDAGPCTLPRNWHDPMAAVRALLVALDEWVTGRAPAARQPPAAHRRRHAGAGGGGGIPARPRLRRRHAPPTTSRRWPTGSNRGRPRAPGAHSSRRSDADGNELAGLKLPDIAVPRGTHTGWNLYKAPYPAGELADRDGSFLAFARHARAAGADRRSAPVAAGALSGRGRSCAPGAGLRGGTAREPLAAG